MIFVYAFLFPALICTVFQFIMNHTKLDLIKILASVWILGGLLFALGIMPVLEKFAGGGAMATIMGAGSMIANSAVLAFQGNVAACIGMLISFVLIMALILVLGILAAVCYMKKNPDFQEKMAAAEPPGGKPKA